MKVATLISDWGWEDVSLGILKGKFFAQLPDCRVIDLTHGVELQSSVQTAFMLEHVYSNFPVGTVHLALTSVSCWSTEKPLLLQKDGFYFIGIDDGTFSMMFEGEVLSVRRYVGTEASTLDMMVNLVSACMNGNWESVTEPANDIVRSFMLRACYTEEPCHISGHVVYIDKHNNVVTNIPATMFQQAMAQHPRIACSLSTYRINKYHAKYESDFVPYFVPNSIGVIEIVMYGGRVRMLSPWQQEVNVEIDFKSK